MPKLKYFSVKELVPPSVYKVRGEKSIQLFDVNALVFLDWARERYGKAFVNDWALKSNGSYTQSGLRTVEFYGSWEKYEKSFSQHKYGRAWDIKFENVSAEEVRRDLEQCWESEGLDFSITVEEGVSWVHVDFRPADKLFNSFWP